MAHVRSNLKGCEAARPQQGRPIMKNRGMIPYIILAGIVLSLAGMLLAQGTPDRTIFVNGKPAGTVTQIAGHMYIDIDSLAQIINGTVTIEPTRILLNIPVPEASTSSGAAQDQSTRGLQLSKEFAQAAIADLAEMREWRGAVGTILTYGVPVVGTWPQEYHDRVQEGLAHAAVAASTTGDQDALGVLSGEFANLSDWTSGIVSTRQAMDATKTVNPNYRQEDPLLAKITTCYSFLNSMLVSGTFSDDSSCH